MTPNPHDLTGHVAIVTGGGSGIGAETAMLLARHGADLVIAGRRAEPLEQQAEAIIAATGRRCLAVPTDVRDEQQCIALAERTFAEFGRIDILINNAGGAQQAPLRTTPTETWMNGFALNMHAAFYCARACLPQFREQGKGVIVNVSSLAGVNGTMGVGAYAPAKAGLQMFTRTAAAEWGPFGVRVNCVAPGMIATPLAQANWAKTGFDAIKACKAFPLRRPGTPQEVAQAVLFMASDASSYITGETLTVGGGPQLKGMIDL